MRVSDLIENQNRTRIAVMLFQYVTQPDVLQRRNFGHNSLMRGIFGYETGKVGGLAIDYGQIRWQVIGGQRLSDSPDFDDPPFGIFDSGHYGMAAPKFGIAADLGRTAAALRFMSGHARSFALNAGHVERVRAFYLITWVLCQFAENKLAEHQPECADTCGDSFAEIFMLIVLP